MEENKGHITINDTAGKGHLPLYEFFIALKRNNFLVTPGQISDVNRVIGHYADRVQSELELCDYLAPIFVNSEEEQIQFRQIFEEFFELNLAKTPSKEELPKPKKNRWIFVLVLLVMTAGVIIFWPKYNPQISMELIPSEVDSLKKSKQLELRLRAIDENKKLSFDTRVDWGDNSPVDSILHHIYSKDGVYNISASVKTRSNSVVKYRDTTIQKAIAICLDPASIKIENPFLGDSVEVGSQFSLNAIITGKQPDSVSWSRSKETYFENGKTNVLTTSENTEGVQTYYFKAFYGDENAPCNVESKIRFFVYDKTPLPKVTFQPTEEAKAITLPNDVHQFWYGVVSIMILYSFYFTAMFAKRRSRQKEEKIEEANENQDQYDAMKRSFSGKMGSGDIPFHNKNFLPLPEPELNDVSRLMRKRISDDATYIHLEKTISKAILNAGFFDPVIASRTQQSEFLVLIDQKKPNDQQAKLFDFLLDLLKKHNVYIDKYYYNSSPLHCYHENEDIEISLEKLSEKYPGHVLLIFGNAYELIYPDYPSIDQDCMHLLNRWQYKAIMTPVSFADWGNKERKVLLEHLPIFPVDIAGQLLLMQKLFGEEVHILSELNQSSDDFYETEMVDFEDLEELLDYCSEVEWATVEGGSKYSNILFQWIAALAVYPKIRWELTLEIGKAILDKHDLAQELNFTTLLRLVRISWIKSGQFPDFTRLKLLKELSAENEIIARETILHAIHEIPETELNKTHFAYEEKETQRLINEFNLYAYDPVKYADYSQAKELFAKLNKEELITDVTAKTYIENSDLNWNTLINKQDPEGGSTQKLENTTLEDYFDETPKSSGVLEKIYLYATALSSLLFVASLIGLVLLTFWDITGKYEVSPFTNSQSTIKRIQIGYNSSSAGMIPKNFTLSIDDSIVNLLQATDTLTAYILVNNSAKQVRLNWNNKSVFDSLMDIRFDSYDVVLTSLPPIDTDGDGVLDEDDNCPNDAGPVANNGCPKAEKKIPVRDKKSERTPLKLPDKKVITTDTDGDGVPDKDDNCINEIGTVANSGCPEDEKPVVVDTDGDGVININSILFDFDKDVITAASKLELEILVQTMKDYNNMKIAIESHTDLRGSKAYNETLSQSRAASTFRYIVSNGIDEARLTYKGFGECSPLVKCGNYCDEQRNLSPCTDSQRDQNNRTVFRVLNPNEIPARIINNATRIKSTNNEAATDSDGDGVLDKDDNCINEVGTVANNGCPETQINEQTKQEAPRDTDGDGVYDQDDKCPDEAGPAANNGCPWPDTDGDGVLDKDDDCPNDAGIVANNGCPQGPINQLNSYSKTILFDTGKSTLRNESLPALEVITSIMKEYSTSNFRIEGHTNSTGSASLNQKLSEARANAVKDYLVANGVNADRLTAIGFGESYPIASNQTTAGRASNNRVEVILEAEDIKKSKN